MREQCLAGALERREPWGVWGGELFANGKVLAQKRRRGRPPKVARPEPVLEELVPVYDPPVPRGGERLIHGTRITARRVGVTCRGTLPPVPQRAPARRGQLASATLARRGRLAQLARAPPLQGGGRGFETLNAHDSSSNQDKRRRTLSSSIFGEEPLERMAGDEHAAADLRA